MTEALTVRQERTPEAIGAEIRDLTVQAKRMTVYYAVEIGRRLKEAKETVGHGGWGDFIRRETEFSQATAGRLMKIFDKYGAAQIGIFGVAENSSTLTNLSISNALRLLAVPEEEREDFAQAVGAEALSVRELEEAIRERDEARQAEAAMKAAKQAAEDAAREETAALRREIQEAKQAAEAAREELEALRSTPPEADPEQLNAARAAAREEAAEEWGQKLAAAEIAAAQAEARQAELARKLSAAEQRLKDGADAGELERLRRELAAAEPAFAAFQAKLETMAAAWGAVMQALQALGPEVQEKMKKALTAQLEQWQEKI